MNEPYILQELRTELKERISAYSNQAKSLELDDRAAFKVRCVLFAYEDIQSLIHSLEVEVNNNQDPED